MTRQHKETRVALVGNPNSGKSSLFNILTGLRQTVSNFPGVTVDKKIGTTILSEDVKVKVIDLPGLYSLYPNSSDERLVVDVLTNPDDINYPDLIIYVADATNLERHLLLATQLIDLKIPLIFALNMVDILKEKNQEFDQEALEAYLQVPVIPISGRVGTNIDLLKSKIQEFLKNGKPAFVADKDLFKIPDKLNPLINDVQAKSNASNTYHAKVLAHHSKWLNHVPEVVKKEVSSLTEKNNFDDIQNQIDETMSRYKSFEPVARETIKRSDSTPQSRTDKIDALITHRFFGPVIFFAIMFFVFQAIYSWSETPMDWIDQLFAFAGEQTRSILPEAWYTDLIVDGIIAGLGGILIFIPQITILFLLISILEETGYMSRAVFMFDGIMQKFGLNGRSIVSLVSSGACAIPAIMATRTISSWKERLNTILVSPLISCSARIPVYTILIGFVVPKDEMLGIFNLQGLAFMGLYLLGIAGAFAAALAFKLILKVDNSNSYLMIELPQYKPPLWKNALLNVKEKVMTFVVEAGKVILLISIVLWFLASFGPSSAMERAEQEAAAYITENNLSAEEGDDLLAGKKIEASYAGHLGKFIEPAIKPLGFDWKIGIALITSFAAREVFVGTMATIYSVGSSEDEVTIKERMNSEINPDTGKKVYNRATSLSLLVFYVFAMQCMSTLAIVRRETRSWKWPIIQFLFMGAMAYLGSLAVYQLLS